MANTQFSDIYHLFLNMIQDYEIKNIFSTDISVAEDLLQTFLLKAVVRFRNCQQDITTLDLDNNQFNVTLTLEEETIVCDLMILEWMSRVINDIRQMNLTLTDNDFKHYAEEKNLEKKQLRLDEQREVVYHEMVEYGLYHTNFGDWANGNYGL